MLDDLYSEVCPLLPFAMFNVCCDETWGLGTGPSKTLADEIGVGRRLRAAHRAASTTCCKDKYGKRMMMWGDIILQHPDKLDQIPKDTVMLTWGYGAGRELRGPDRAVRQVGLRVLRLPGHQQLEPHPARLRRGDARTSATSCATGSSTARWACSTPSGKTTARRCRATSGTATPGAPNAPGTPRPPRRRISTAASGPCCSASRATISARRSNCWPRRIACRAWRG